MKSRAAKATSLLKRALGRSINMFPFELERLSRLIGVMKQFNRIKFNNATPQKYYDVIQSVESLIPTEMRQQNYVAFEQHGGPSAEFLGDYITGLLLVAARRSCSIAVRGTLQPIIDSKMYEPSELFDVSSDDSPGTPNQQVPDIDESKPKIRKVVDQAEGVSE